MSDKPKAFFGGLWVPIREQMTTPVRPAILFLGDCYFVRFHLDPSDKTLHIDSRTHVVEGDWGHHGSMNPEEEGDDIISFRWRLADKGRLEFEEKRRKYNMGACAGGRHGCRRLSKSSIRQISERVRQRRTRFYD